MKAIRLRTEYMKNPLGIDITQPLLTWNCDQGITQTACEVEASSEGQVIWDSGKVASEQMGMRLGVSAGSRQRVSWKARLWDETGTPGEWSEEAFFEMGLLEKSQFTAKWINPELTCDPEIHKPASCLKTTFMAEKTGRARLYITCHGLYEAWINGNRVGEFVLAPGTCTYGKRLVYQTYDVTDLVRQGENEVRVLLGDGWYRSCSGVDGDRNLFGEDVALYFQLEMDGKAVCISDESWTASQEGPLRENDMQQGEVVDAMREEMWLAGTDPDTAQDFHAVKVENFGVENLVCSNSVPILEHERFEGRLIRTPNGDTVIDYGQNLAGYTEFTLQAHKGDRIILTHGESLDENGNFTAENFQDRKRHKEGGTRQQVVYTCKEGENHYKSKFTIWGFRYAKVETDMDLSDASFTAIAVYSKMEQLGRFECSDPAVNQLVRNSIWSQKSNFCDVPTDCPTRERAAWTGDMGVFAETGLYLADCYPVIRKWLGEVRLNQYEDGRVPNIAPPNNRSSFFSGLLAGSVGWGDACVLVPYAMYQRYGDKRILEENYEMMQKWYRFLEGRAAQKMPPMGAGQIPTGAERGGAGQIPAGAAVMAGAMSGGAGQMPAGAAAMAAAMSAKLGQAVQQAVPAAPPSPYADYTIESGIDYGEWCEPDVESTQAMGAPQPKVATAYLAHSGELLAEIAETLGKTEDAAHYRETSEKAKKAFRFLAAPDGRIRSDRQAEYVRAIAFDLLPEEEKEQAAADLNDLVVKNSYHLNTGFLSTPSLCPVLAQYGYTDTAYRLLLQDTIPGWLYEVKKGATTIWENWDGINEKGEVKASLNHYSYGAVCGWLFGGVCGIQVRNGKILIRPQPDRALQYAKASYQSPMGEIVSGWRYEDDRIIYEIQIPANTEAEVLLPDGRKERLKAGSYCL